MRNITVLLIALTTSIVTPSIAQSLEKATFGAGCFWCTVTIFEQLKGVESVSSGYTGGKKIDPTYKEVCTGTTGHAEVTMIKFDPEIISYSNLLEIFWEIHDPTTLNQQGADVGTQYRSVIYYHSEQQKEEALFFKAKLNEENIFPDPIVTEISPAVKFYSAENYHQDYYSKNQNQPYCRLVITPKVEKFKKVFSEQLK